MIIVSGCLILTAVNLIVLIRKTCITERLVTLCKIYLTFYIGLHDVCVRVGGRTLRHNQIFSDGKFTKFSYPWCSAARASRARAPLKKDFVRSTGVIKKEVHIDNKFISATIFLKGLANLKKNN